MTPVPDLHASLTDRYYQWIADHKIDVVASDGFYVDPDSMHPSLFPHQRDMVAWASSHGKGLIAASFGLGKCHGAGTPILMADGSIKAVENVQVGDRLMGDDGTPRNVLALGRGQEEMYRVTLKNGDTYTCNQSHIMSLQVSNHYGALRLGDVVDMSIDEYIDLPYHARRNCFKHYKVAIDFPYRPVPFDSYLYGAWLGDGHRRDFAWTINDRDTAIVERIENFATERELVVRESQGRGCTTYFVTRQLRGHAPHCDEFYFAKGSSDGNGKHIDPVYLRNSRQVRLELLAGLLDTDGYLIDKCYEIATKWEGLRDDILYLARSLGFSVTHGPKIVNGVTYYRIFISGNTHLIPCITRKKAEERRQIKRPLVYGFTVDPIGEGDYYGFEIDGNHRYLLGDFTVTHNTRSEIELLRQVVARNPGKQVLVICPLGVKYQFSEEDGPAMGVRFQYVRTDAECEASTTPYLITNYERPRDGDISADYIRDHIVAVSLDEGNVLRSLGSITQQTFLSIFQPVKYKWIATATPDPNHYRELIYYADFLGIADHGQILTRWFKRDSQHAGNLTIHPHHEEAFWMWVASWALFIEKPSDLGYSDDGYDMPALNVQWHRVASNHERAWEETDSWGQRYLFRDSAASITQAIREKRDTLPERVRMAAEIVDAHSPDTHWVIWHHLEAERHAIRKALPEAVDVYGSQPIDEREQRILDFTHGNFRILATKPEIAGSGCNFQYHCHNAIYVGIRYQFDEFIQSVHRLRRFLQKHPVTIHIIYTDAEDNVVQVMKRKWTQHEKQVETMTAIVRKFGLTSEALKMTIKRSLGVNRVEVGGQFFTAVNNDCVVELDRMEANSVDLIHTSIPFSKHYEYTAQREDFGYNGSNEAFFEQMAFLVPNLLRVLKPGRIAAIHVKDLLEYGHLTGLGFATVYEFSDDTIRAFKKHGFAFVGRITITTDVVRENNSTYRLGWTENSKDGTKMGVGMPEYLLLFRKPPTDSSRAYSDVPVAKDKAVYTRMKWQTDAHSYWRSSGDRPIAPEEMAEIDPARFVGMETGSVYRWYREYSKRTTYDLAKHVAMGEPMEEAGRLPATFGLFLPQAPDFAAEDVWTDIIAMNTLNSSQSWRKIETHVCLARDTKVLTRRGYVPIQDVTIDDEVLTHLGRWRKVQVVKNTGVRPVVKLAAHGVANLILTPDHNVWARKVGDGAWQLNHSRQAAKKVTPDWLSAEESKGSYVNLKTAPIEDDDHDLGYWWMVGRWLADGHIDKRGVAHICCGRHKVDEFLANAGDFAANPPRDTGTALDFSLRDKGFVLRSTLSRCGHGAANKQLPPAAYGLDTEKSKALLDGYLSGDGHCEPKRDRWMATSVSRDLLLGLAMLAQRAFGVVASIHAGRPAGQATIEGRLVNTQQEWGLSFNVPNGHRKDGAQFILDDGAWKRVRNVTPLGEAETWCLRVEEDESFTAEGCIVKNCPLPFDIVERVITRYSNPGELVLDPFSGLFTVPMKAIEMSRRAYGIELSPEYFGFGVRYCRDAEAKRAAPSLFDLLPFMTDGNGNGNGKNGHEPIDAIDAFVQEAEAEPVAEVAL